jgi:PAS domain S-box-containing protein
MYAYSTPRGKAPNKVPESLNIREDLPVAAELRTELEALRLQSAALTSAANAVSISDRDGTISWVNPAFTTLTGYKSAEAIGKNLRDLVKSDKQNSAVYDNLRETILAGHIWHGELVNRRKDGSLYDEAQTVTPVRDASGEIAHFISIKQDVTKAKTLETELKTLHARLHKAMEFSPAVHYTLKFEGDGVRQVYVSENLERLVGVAVNDATSNWWRDSLHPDDRERVMAILANVTKSDGYSMEYRIRHKSGAYIWVHDSSRVVRGSLGLPKELTGILLDITERKLADEKLKQSEAKFRSVVEQSLFGIYIIQGNRFVYVNEKFSQIFGYEKGEIVAFKSFIDLVGDKDRSLVTNNILKRLLGKIPVLQYDFLAKKKDGTPINVEVYGTNIELDGKPAVVGSLLDITDSKRTEEKLRLFRALMDQSTDSIEVIEPESGRFLDVSENALKERGYSREEFLSLKVADLDPMLREADWPQRAESIRAAGSLRGEGIHRRKDGTTFPMEFNARWVHLDRDYIVSVVRDISERKRADEMFIASELRYRRLFETAKDGILILDAETGMVMDVNPFLIEKLGFSRERFFGKRIWELVFFKDILANASAFKELQEKKFIRYDDKRLRTADGRQIDVEFVSNVYLVGNQKVIQCNIRDTTELKRSERELREQNEIILNAHEALMVVDLANKVSLWNHGAEQLFGWTAAEALGQPPEKMLGSNYLETVDTLRSAVERDGFWSGEVKAQTRGGRKLILKARITQVRDAAGRPRARLNFLADITEEKLLERKFLEAQRLESIGMLASGIAHDLNNVLAPIMFGVPMLRQSLSAPRDLKILETIGKSTERGAGLVRQILGFVQSTTGEFLPIQMSHVVNDIVSVAEETFPKSIQIEHDVPADLCLVKCNPTQIHQALLNLCINARDAMPQGGTLRVAMADRRLDENEARLLPDARPGSWLVIEISDTGTGIAPEALAHVWDPFFTTKGPGKGTGLGLSSVRRIVALHDGFVTLDTQLGHGTTFRVFLPATAEISADMGAAPVSAPPEGDNELILVAEDDTLVRDDISAILSRHHYRVLSASDGVEAVEKFAAHSLELALVVVDVEMPRMDGAALARILAQLRSDLRLLAISGLSYDDLNSSRLEAARKLTHSFLLKPFTAEALLKAVHSLLHPSIGP